MSTAQRAIAPPLRLIAILAVATAIGPFAMQVFLPALPSIQEGFGVSAATAQLVFSMSGIAMAVATLFYGPISDRYGRRPTMLIGLVLFLLGSALCAAAPSIEALILGRIVQAAGGIAGMVLARAVIRDLFNREQAASALSYVTMAMVVAPMLAPALGGITIDLYGWRAVFVLGGLVGVVVLVAVWLELTESRRPTAGGGGAGGMLRSFGVLLRSGPFLAFMAQGAFSMSVFFAFLAAAPYVMVKILHLPPTQYGLMFILVSSSFMVGNFLSARLGHRLGVDRMILLGSFGTLLGSGIALTLILVLPWSPWSIFLPMMITALAQGMAMPNAQAAVLSVRPDLAGAASGLAGFGQMATASLVAQLIGSIQTGTPYPMAIGMLACSVLMTGAALLACRR